MTRFTRPGTLLVTALLAAGCSDSPSPVQPGEPLFAKPVATPESRANWVWHATMIDGTATRIFGDGKDKGGATLSSGDSEYQGDHCGVRANIQPADKAGDAPFDPAYTASAACARKILFNLDGATTTSVARAHAYRINRVDDTRPRIMMFAAVPIAQCESLRYGVISDAATLDAQIISSDPSTGVVVTRVKDSNNTPVVPAQWTVETVNGGKARCHNWSKNKWVPAANPVYLPFRITITEVPPSAS